MDKKKEIEESLMEHKLETDDEKFAYNVAKRCINDCFKAFDSAKEFYKTYHHNMDKLRKEQPDVYEKMSYAIKGRYQLSTAFSMYDKNDYRDWLFHYIFEE